MDKKVINGTVSTDSNQPPVAKNITKMVDVPESTGATKVLKSDNNNISAGAKKVSKFDRNLFKTAALGGITQNPVFVLVLGMCPLIATSTSFLSSLYMGLSTMFVLICSNVILSSLRNVIPSTIRLPASITIIAALVTVLQLFLDRFMPDFYESVSTFIALIAVNCIIMGRVEAFALKNNVLSSFVDGVSMGLGFTAAICLLGGMRQLFGVVLKIDVFIRPAGGFIALGLLMALFSCIVFYIKKNNARKSREDAKKAREEATL